MTRSKLDRAAYPQPLTETQLAALEELRKSTPVESGRFSAVHAGDLDAYRMRQLFRRAKPPRVALGPVQETTEEVATSWP